MNDENQNDYWRRVCEKDAAWEAFCRFPTGDAWRLYTEACRAEDEAYAQLGEQHIQVETVDVCTIAGRAADRVETGSKDDKR